MTKVSKIDLFNYNKIIYTMYFTGDFVPGPPLPIPGHAYHACAAQITDDISFYANKIGYTNYTCTSIWFLLFYQIWRKEVL